VFVSFVVSITKRNSVIRHWGGGNCVNESFLKVHATKKAQHVIGTNPEWLCKHPSVTFLSCFLSYRFPRSTWYMESPMYTGLRRNHSCASSTSRILRPIVLLGNPQVLCGSEDNLIYVWDLQTQRVKQRLSCHTGQFSSCFGMCSRTALNSTLWTFLLCNSAAKRVYPWTATVPKSNSVACIHDRSIDKAKAGRLEKAPKVCAEVL